MADQKPARVTLARVLRPQGRRGEIAAEILTDFSERLTQLRSVELWDERRGSRTAAVRACRLSHSRGGQAIFHFEGSDSISDAEKLIGLEIQIPLADRVELPAGSYFVTDLIGCDVIDRKAAAPTAKVGTVTAVQPIGEDVPGTPVLIVDSLKGELLIPLAQEICVHIDVAARRIEIIPPEGLLDLN